MMQRGQLGIQLVRYGLRFLVPALITSFLQHPASAQTDIRRGVSLDVVEATYTIRGSTAEALLVQMRTLGPPGVTRYRSFFRWNYTPEQRGNERGAPSNRCRIREFETRFDITEVYPVWERHPDAPPELVEAWESFENLIDQQREQYRDGLVEYGVEMRRRARRMEEACPFLRNRMQDIVDEAGEERAEEWREARESGEAVRLRWPPEGFSQQRPPA